MDEFWMCYVDGYRMPKKRHDKLEVARGEAARLATLFPTRTVYIMSIMSAIEPTAERDEINRLHKEPSLPQLSRKELKAVAAKQKIALIEKMLASAEVVEPQVVARKEPPPTVVVVKKRRTIALAAA